MGMEWTKEVLGREGGGVCVASHEEREGLVRDTGVPGGVNDGVVLGLVKGRRKRLCKARRRQVWGRGRRRYIMWHMKCETSKLKLLRKKRGCERSGGQSVAKKS